MPRAECGRSSSWCTLQVSIRSRAAASDRNGGRTWRQATLKRDARTPWSWTFWRLDADLATGEHELVVCARNGAGQTQPVLPDDTWNFKGYLSAA